MHPPWCAGNTLGMKPDCKEARHTKTAWNSGFCRICRWTDARVRTSLRGEKERADQPPGRPAAAREHDPHGGKKLAARGSHCTPHCVTTAHVYDLQGGRFPCNIRRERGHSLVILEGRRAFPCNIRRAAEGLLCVARLAVVLLDAVRDDAQHDLVRHWSAPVAMAPLACVGGAHVRWEGACSDLRCARRAHAEPHTTRTCQSGTRRQ